MDHTFLERDVAPHRGQGGRVDREQLEPAHAVGGEALSIENGAVRFPAMVSMDWRIIRIEGR